MISRINTLVIKQAWQTALDESLKKPEELLSQLGLIRHLDIADGNIIKQFPLRVTQSYINKMRYGDPDDPLLRQVFPLINENIDVKNFITDPVGDHMAIIAPGILQKYYGRTLLITTGACAIHCRYCFRRYFPYGDSNPLASKWISTLQLIDANNSIHEVILSGGDPLILTNYKLAQIINDIEKIKHVKRIRIHTRMPIVLPERIDSNLLKLISASRLQIIMVIHSNHANEIDQEVANSLKLLQITECQLLNQSVLLKDVNNNIQSLYNLSERLSEVNVIPYYLHLLDRVRGASHFNVSEQQGIELINQLRTLLPGYLVPRLVRELQGEDSKTIIL